MLTYKTSDPATSIIIIIIINLSIYLSIHLCETKRSHETPAYKWNPVVTLVPAPLNQAEASRLTDLLHNTGLYRKQTSTKRFSALRQRPRFPALSLAARDALPRLLRTAERLDWTSITEHRKYPFSYSVVENAEQQTTLKAFPTLRK